MRTPRTSVTAVVAGARLGRAGRVQHVLCVALAVILAGCGGANDKAGGSQEKEVVLTLANHEPDKADVESWIGAVEELSGGSIRIEVLNRWRDLEVDYEERTVADLRAGKVDLAKIGARAWDEVGVTSFQALVAPLLVDSYELQRDVLQGSIGERMLAGVEELDLVGLAILPGWLRKPLGVTRVLKHPDDFLGARIGIRPGGVAETTLRALGATPVGYLPDSKNQVAALDGAELDMTLIVVGGYAPVALAVTANVNLWPRAVTIAINKPSFERLSAAQQEALRAAGARAFESTLDFVQGSAGEHAVALCRGGFRLTRASELDLTALYEALEPVYAKLASDPLNAEFIDAIHALKEGGTGPDSPKCAPATGTSTVAGESELDGIYRSKVTRGELLAHPAYQDGEDHPGNYGDFTLEFAQGKFEWTGSTDGIPMGGRFSVDAGMVTLEAEYPPDVDGSVFVYRWSKYRDTISFTKVTSGPTHLVVHPWRAAHASPKKDG